MYCLFSPFRPFIATCFFYVACANYNMTFYDSGTTDPIRCFLAFLGGLLLDQGTGVQMTDMIHESRDADSRQNISTFLVTFLVPIWCSNCPLQRRSRELS